MTFHTLIYLIVGTPRSRQIFLARSLLISVCLGTADRLLRARFCHHECRPPFPKEFASLRSQIRDQLVPFHTAIRSSAYRSPAAERASSLLRSKASRSVTLRLSMRSSRVLSWQLTPGTYSIHPIHHSPSCLITAVYSLLMSFSSLI